MTPDDASSGTEDVAADEVIGGLSPRDLVIVASVVTGSTYGDAALLAGVSESTVDRLMRRPEVKAAADTARLRRAQQIADLLDSRLDAAVDALADAMTTGDTTASRVTAARTLLEQARRWRDHSDLADRVYEIERQLRERGDR